MNDKEIKLLNEMKENCVNQANYIDSKAMEKYNLLRHMQEIIKQLEEDNKQLKKQLYDEKNKYKNILYNQLAEDIEPDCEEFYLCEIEEKANTLEKLKQWIKKVINELIENYSDDNYNARVYNEVLIKIKELEDGVKDE